LHARLAIDSDQAKVISLSINLVISKAAFQPSPKCQVSTLKRSSILPLPLPPKNKTHVTGTMIAKIATKAIGQSVAIVNVTAMGPETVRGIENGGSGAESAGGTETETTR
jgi:hypothetical protein